MGNVRFLEKIVVAKSISGDKFETVSRINVGLRNAHAQALSSQKSPKVVSDAESVL